jgi:hypothetical protein
MSIEKGLRTKSAKKRLGQRIVVELIQIKKYVSQRGTEGTGKKFMEQCMLVKYN